MSHDFEIYYDDTSTKVDVRNRAVNYGDGCFTTLLFNGDDFCLLNEHIARLVEDANGLSINLNKEALKNRLAITLDKIKLQHHGQYKAIKILLSRGIGGRGYQTPDRAVATIYISVHACATPLNTHEALSGGEYHMGICDFRMASQPLLAGIKHLNRLEQVLAKHRLKALPHLDDFIMLDTDNLIVEATSANIFVMHNDCWYTPSLEQCGVNGVMRKHVLNTMHKYNIDVEVGDVHVDTLRNAQSLFLTNAIAVILPVSHLYLHNNHENCITLDSANNNDLCKLLSVINSKTLKSEQPPS